MEQEEEFYIGYQDEAPESYRKWIVRLVLILSFSVPGLAFLIAMGQSGISSGTFEYGTWSEVEGWVFEKPYPHLRIVHGKDRQGIPIGQTLLLVGPRKTGAKDIVEGFIADEAPLWAKLRGTWIYDDGKGVFELTQGSKSLVNSGTPPATAQKPLSVGKFPGTQTLQGEIVDPKCHFGAMNPGEGAVHQQCAALCVLGGIPPVLKVVRGTSYEYYILVTPDGLPMSEEITDYMGRPVQLSGKISSLDDWFILYVEGTPELL